MLHANTILISFDLHYEIVAACMSIIDGVCCAKGECYKLFNLLEDFSVHGT